MEFNKIILTRGIQGSGKSTYAKNWVKEDPIHRVRFNNDDIRNMLGVYWVPEREGLVKEIKVNFLHNAMSQGYDIIIDNMNLNPKEIDFYKEVVEEFNKIDDGLKYKIEFKDFFIPLEECLLRDSLRQNPIGEKVIRDTFRKYRSLIQSIESKKCYDTLTKQDGNLPHCILVDLDGTIALNLSGRPFYGNGAAEGIENDIPISPVIDIVKRYPNTVIFLTGRENTNEIRNATLEWIKKQFGSLDNKQLIMRQFGDSRNGAICKKELYETYIKGNWYVDFVLEDSEKIVKMYRDLDLIVLQPNKNAF